MAASHLLFLPLQPPRPAKVPYIKAISDPPVIMGRPMRGLPLQRRHTFTAACYTARRKSCGNYTRRSGSYLSPDGLCGEESIKQQHECAAKYLHSPNLQLYQADVLAEQGQEEESLEKYKQLLRDYPNLPDLRCNLDMLYRKRGEWAKALGMLKDPLPRGSIDDYTASGVSASLLRLKQYQIIARPPRTSVEKASAAIDHTGSGENTTEA